MSIKYDYRIAIEATPKFDFSTIINVYKIKIVVAKLEYFSLFVGWGWDKGIANHIMIKKKKLYLFSPSACIITT